MRIKVTQQQRDNALLMLHKYWPSVPEANVVPQLSTWRYGEGRDEPPTCGTVACAGGWAAWIPEFRAQGVTASWDGSPETAEGNAFDASEMLFGNKWMFASRSHEKWPNEKDFTGTDHELVTRRLEWLIANSEVEA